MPTPLDRRRFLARSAASAAALLAARGGLAQATPEGPAAPASMALSITALTSSGSWDTAFDRQPTVVAKTPSDAMVHAMIAVFMKHLGPAESVRGWLRACATCPRQATQALLDDFGYPNSRG